MKIALAVVLGLAGHGWRWSTLWDSYTTVVFAAAVLGWMYWRARALNAEKILALLAAAPAVGSERTVVGGHPMPGVNELIAFGLRGRPDA